MAIDRITDIDIQFGFHHLVERPSSANRGSVWTTSRVPNLLCALGTLVMAGLGILLWKLGGPVGPDAPGHLILTPLFRLMWLAGFVGTVLGAVHHGTLTVDFDRRELRAKPGLLTPGGLRVLPLDEIRRLEYVLVAGHGIPEHQCMQESYVEVLVAELDDDRTALITLDSPRSLRATIARAHGRMPSEKSLSPGA